jgi:hypothetical protein
MSALTTPEQIAIFRLIVLIKATELEGKGFRRRGPSALSLLKQALGASGSRETVLAIARARLPG